MDEFYDKGKRCGIAYANSEMGYSTFNYCLNDAILESRLLLTVQVFSFTNGFCNGWNYIMNLGYYELEEMD